MRSFFERPAGSTAATKHSQPIVARAKAAAPMAVTRKENRPQPQKDALSLAASDYIRKRKDRDENEAKTPKLAKKVYEQINLLQEQFGISNVDFGSPFSNSSSSTASPGIRSPL